MRFVSLRVRFMSIAIILTLVSSAVWGGWVWQREHRLLIERFSREGEMLVSTIATPIINILLYEELGILDKEELLDNLIAQIMSNTRLDARYAMILDPRGKVIAHNDYGKFGQIFDDPLSMRALAADDFIKTNMTLDNERLSDMAMPLSIAGKSWGCLRVGVSMEPAYRDIVRLGGQILMFSGSFSVGALVIFWMVGTLLTHPLKQLSRRMEGIGSTLPPLSIEQTRHDEIGLLQKSFAEMVARLSHSEEERKKSVVRMLENERIVAIGRLVSGVAHEVNNPLAGIEGALYQIEHKGGEQIQRYVALVRQSIERIERIVSQLSDLSRVGEIVRKPIDSKQFFDDLVMFARMTIKDTGCHLSMDNRCPPTTLLLDRHKIHQVVLNLVINAADATGNTGLILLIAELDRKGNYLLHVENTGPAIPQEIANDIFTPFFTTKEPGRGSGMGLAVSRGIAETHGGSLIYRRGENRTIFTLTIPDADFPEAAAHDQQ